MGLFDFFRPPTEDKFAQQFMAALKQAGDGREARYDPESFTLHLSSDEEDAGTRANLTNMYHEHCQVPWRKRRVHLGELVRATLSYLKKPPQDFEDARLDLRPKIWTRSTLERTRLQHELEGLPHLSLPTEEIGSHLLAGLVYDWPESMQSISDEALELWGVTHFEAMEAARQNLEETQFAFAKIGDGLYASMTGDNYDSSRLMMLDLIRSLEMDGHPVALVPNRDTLLLAGSEDTESLKIMADFAEKTLEENPRPMTGMAIQLAGDTWTDWMPQRDHPLYRRFHDLDLKWHYGEYSDQKEMLEAIYEKNGVDLFVASMMAVEHKDGRLLSIGTWAEGVSTLLPKTDMIAFVTQNGEIVAQADWERVQSVAGELMQQVDAYPARFHVEAFPSPEQLAEIGSEEL